MLPRGYSARPPQPHDLDRVAALASAAERADIGKELLTREDLAADWAQPNFDLQRDAVVIETEGAIVAAAETFRGRAEVRIHPDRRGLGLGEWLLRWTEERGREKGELRARQTLLDRNAQAAATLLANGYRVGYVSWVLEIDLHEQPPEPKAPHGIELRRFVPGRHERAVFEVIEDAFGEWDYREPASFEDWAALVTRRPDFDPGLLDVAADGGQIVGACVGLVYPDEGGWIQQLAVKASHRRRGIARALLQRAFCTAWARGHRACGLSTDSRGSALAFYENAGMHVKTTATSYVKDL